VADLQAVVERDPACDTHVQPLWFFKGFQVGGCMGLAGWAGGRKAGPGAGMDCSPVSEGLRGAGLRRQEESAGCAPRYQGPWSMGQHACSRLTACLCPAAPACASYPPWPCLLCARLTAGHPGAPRGALDVAAGAQVAGRCAAEPHERGVWGGHPPCCHTGLGRHDGPRHRWVPGWGGRVQADWLLQLAAA
jgi:hypothetical protein